MRRGVSVLLLAVAIFPAWPSAAGRLQTRSPIPVEHVTTLKNAFAAYSAGDDLAVEALLRTRDGILSMGALDAVFGRPADWTRATAAFLAEVAVAAPTGNRGKMTSIRIGQALAMSRTEFPGTNTPDDRAEMLWHQIVLGIYQEMKAYPVLLDYLDAMAPRFDEATRRGAVLPARFSLARAIATAGVCCPPKREDALVLFDRAAADPALATEARIRGAVLQLNMTRAADTIVWLDRVPAEPTDNLLRYAQSLTRARALDLLDQPEAAAAAYEAARVEFPTAQTPAIGRAAALLRSGQTAEAVRLAGAARRLPPEAPDPWADFLKADARFVKPWLAELRTLRK